MTGPWILFCASPLRKSTPGSMLSGLPTSLPARNGAPPRVDFGQLCARFCNTVFVTVCSLLLLAKRTRSRTMKQMKRPSSTTTRLRSWLEASSSSSLVVCYFLLLTAFALSVFTLNSIFTYYMYGKGPHWWGFVSATSSFYPSPLPSHSSCYQVHILLRAPWDCPLAGSVCGCRPLDVLLDPHSIDRSYIRDRCDVFALLCAGRS